MSGDIYFAQRNAGGWIKVGRSDNVRGRLRALRVPGVNLRLIGTVPAWGSAGETYVHRLLAEHRFVGEWFWPRLQVWKFIAASLECGELLGFSAWWTVESITRLERDRRARRDYARRWRAKATTGEAA